MALDANDTIPDSCSSNASVLQWILETKWALGKTDKDAVVMMHEVDYILEGKKYSVQSSLVLTGKNHEHTAMASTVGLPLGIAAEAYLKGQLNITGLHIPTIPEIYQPILSKLKEEGIARELVNKIQGMRKDSDFELTDKIEIFIEKNTLIDNAILNFKNYICTETLANKIELVENIQTQSLNVEVEEGVFTNISITKLN